MPDPLKILAIDDHAEKLSALQVAVQGALRDVVVITAVDGPQGIARARAEDPDVIVLHDAGAGEDRCATCRALKADERTQHIPVLFLTAQGAGREERYKALAAGADGFLTWPLEDVALIAQIRAMAKIKSGNVQLWQARAGRAEAAEALHKDAERWHRIIKALPDGIAITSMDGVVLQVSDEAWRMCGYAGPEEILGRRFLAFIDPSCHPIALARIQEMLAGRYTGPAEYLLIRKDGSRFPVEVNAEALRDQTGAATHLLFITRDITRRKRAEQALQESEDKYHALFNQSVWGVYLHDLDGRILDVNQMACRQSGYSREELLQLTIFDLLPSQGSIINLAKEEILHQWRLWQPQERLTIEVEHRTKDGAIIPVEISTGAIRYGDQNLILAIVLDITERKRAVEALCVREQEARRQNEALLRLMLHGAVFRGDLAVALAEITEACAEIIGTERASIWRHNADRSVIHCLDLYELSKGQHSAGEALQSANFPAYMEAHQRGEVIAARDVRTDPRTRELPAHYLDAHDIYSMVDAPVWLHGAVGGIVSFEHTGAPRTWTAEDERFCATMAALVSLCFEAAERANAEAALRESEANYRRILDNLQDAYFQADIEGRFTIVSQSAPGAYGYDSVDEMIGLPASTLYADPHARQTLVALLKANGRVMDYVTQGRRKDGTTFWVSMNAQFVTDKNGQIIGTEGIVRNITERRQAEEMLQRQSTLQGLLVKLSAEFINLPLERIDTAIEAALQELAGFVSAGRAYIFNYDFQAGTCSNTFEWCAPGVRPLISELQNVPLEQATDWVATHQRGEELVIPDVNTLPMGALRTLLESQDVKSLMTAPMMGKDGLLGFAGFDAVTQGHEFGAEEILVLRLFSQMLVNVTERRRTEAELRRTNRFLDMVIENIPDTIFVKEAEALRFVRFNRAGEALLGVSREELAGKNDYDLVPREQAEYFIAKDREVLQSGRLHDIPHEAIDTKFGRRILHTKKLAILDDQGRPAYLLGIAEDITEQVQAREAQAARLRQQAVVIQLSQLALRAAGLAELFDLAVTQTAKTLGVEYCKVLELLPDGSAVKLVAGVGWQPGLVGATTLDVNRDSQAGFTLSMNEPVIVEDLRTEQRFSGPQVLHDHGIISGVSVVIHTAEKQYGVLGVHTSQPRTFTSDDVHFVQAVASLLAEAIQRLQAEEALAAERMLLRTLVDNLPDSVYVKDAAGRKTLANPANFHKIGATSEAEVLGKTDFEFFPADLAMTFVADDQRVLQTGQPLLNREERVTLPDGSQRWQTTSKVPLRDSAGRIIGLVGIGHDITERKRAEEAVRTLNAELEARVAQRTQQLRAAQQQLIQQERLAVVGQLAGGMGHELRNPLGVISNAVYYLRQIQPDASEKVKQYLTIIHSEVVTAEKIVRDLLDFAHPREADPAPAQMSGLVREALVRFPPPAGVRVRQELPGDLPDVRVDPHQVVQALGNLITNAYQAMPGGGELVIRASGAGADGARLVAISVCDTGVGVAAEDLGKLFEPLFTTKMKGFGLGLAISKKLIEANGGRIEAQSQPGAGSTFTFWLPV